MERSRPLSGTPGDDSLRGNRDDNVLDASQGGSDVVEGRGGDDTIYFGAALTPEDLVDGFKGHDTLVLRGDYAGGLTIDPHFILSIEQISLFSGGSYVLDGQLLTTDNLRFVIDASMLLSADYLHFDGSHSESNVLITGGSGNDIMAGSTVGDGTFGDILKGGSGDDALTAGRAGASLNGGLGADILTSGGKATSIDYNFEAESTKRDPDLIIGFGAGDVLFLTPVDADTTQAGDQAFHFGATPGHVGDLTVHYNKAQDLTIVRAYTDGDARADMVIHLQGHVPLTPADFAL